MFAQTEVAFEKVALKFALLNDKEPLKAFLKEKLSQYRDNIKVRCLLFINNYNLTCKLFDMQLSGV